MYKPASYLTRQSCPFQLELLRIRTQHTIHIIPSQLHYAFQHARADYKDRRARTALLQAQQYSGTNSTLYANAQPPRRSSKSSLINFKASHAYRCTGPSPLRILYTTLDDTTGTWQPPSTSAHQRPTRMDYRSHPSLW